jgi:hypothetical protein
MLASYLTTFVKAGLLPPLPSGETFYRPETWMSRDGNRTHDQWVYVTVRPSSALGSINLE